VKTWYRSLTRIERVVLIVCCVAIPAEVASKAFGHATALGDFNIHREFGLRFLAGTSLYKDNLCFNYMPVSALFYAPLALFHPAVASVLRLTTALGCLALTLFWLGRMVSGRARPGSWRGMTVGAVAVLLSIQYVVRDLDDGGPHLIYLGILVGAVYCVRLGREGLGAVGFGLVIALKMTPGLLLPFFVWKRKWRLAGLTAGATAAWIVVPALWMGPTRWWDHQRQWNRMAFNVVSDRPDSIRDGNDIRVQNQSLRPAVERFLVTYPIGHGLKVDHAADVPLLDLHPRTASRLGILAVLCLTGIVAVWSRRPDSGRDDPAWPVEVAAVLLLVPLLSPVTWIQHIVFAIPAVYLLVAGHRSFRPLGLPVLATIGLYCLLANVLNRGLIGRDASLVLYSYHVHTFAMLLLLGALMAARPTEPHLRSDKASAREPTSERLKRIGQRPLVSPREQALSQGIAREAHCVESPDR
jgi:alpha-1,2-mannosyltransferase